MSKVGRILGEIAAGSSNVYRIVFTALLLWELYRFRKGGRRAEVSHSGPDFRRR